MKEVHFQLEIEPPFFRHVGSFGCGISQLPKVTNIGVTLPDVEENLLNLQVKVLMQQNKGNCRTHVLSCYTAETKCHPTRHGEQKLPYLSWVN